MFNFLSKYENITVNEIKSKVSCGAILLDIRSEEAFSQGHIKDALNIPLKQLPLKLNQLDKSKEVLVICYMGGSSVMACKLLSSAGYKVSNVLGGMEAWVGEKVGE